MKRILKELQLEMPDLSVQEIEFASPVGSKIAIENNVTYPPAIFLGDRLIAKGKIFAEEIVAAIRTTRGVHG